SRLALSAGRPAFLLAPGEDASLRQRNGDVLSRMRDECLPVPTQRTDDIARCFCGAEITTASVPQHIQTAHRSTGRMIRIPGAGPPGLRSGLPSSIGGFGRVARWFNRGGDVRVQGGRRAAPTRIPRGRTTWLRAFTTSFK